MAAMTKRMFLILNAASFLFLTVFLLSFHLSIVPFALALAIMILNLYYIIQLATLPPSNLVKSPERLFVNEGRSDLSEFQRQVREAYDQSMCRQADKFRGQEYYWNRNHVRQEEEIEELRKNPLVEEYKASLSRRSMVSHREQGSSAKKVRTFFQDEEGAQQKVKEKIAELMAEWIRSNAQLEVKTEELKPKVITCLKIMKEYINNKLEAEIQTIIQNFQAVNRFLSRCFSVTLTLQRPSDLTLTYAELKQLVRVLISKQIIPPRFTSSLSFVEVISEFTSIRRKYEDLPNFSCGPQVLRMYYAIKHLQKEFPNENIVLADHCKEEKGKQGEPHVIRVQDSDRFFYNREPQVKSKQPAAILLLVVMKLMGKYHRSNHLARSIHAEVQTKYHL